MPDVPTKKCPKCDHPTPLPIALVAEDEGKTYLLFYGECPFCSLFGDQIKVCIAVTIRRSEFLNLRANGVPLAR